MAVSRTRQVLGVVLLGLLLATVGQCFLRGVEEVEHHSRGTPSESADRAQADGVLEHRVVLATPVLNAEASPPIEFEDAWIERRSQVVYRYFLSRRREPIGGHILAYTLKRPHTFGPVETLGILFGDDEWGSWNSRSGSGRSVHWREIEPPLPDTLRFRLCEHRYDYKGNLRPPAHGNLPACANWNDPAHKNLPRP